MSQGFYKAPPPFNELNLLYAPGSPERTTLKHALKHMKSEEADLPIFIGGKEIYTGDKAEIHPPHETAHLLGYYHKGNASHIRMAISAAMDAKRSWENMSWENRASIFLKAADLLAGPYRAKINAATMLGQSKNVFQAEIDAACEFIDFLRFNVSFAEEIYQMQPLSSHGIWNRMQWRPLEGFVFAITPFNFTSIAGNLPTSAAIMGNTVVWKPSQTQIYSAWVIMDVLRKSGLPDGVINLIYTGGAETSNIIFNDPDFGGIHFTGSTPVFHSFWKSIGDNIDKYKSYPRIVGETGGKDFIIAHPSASVNELVTALCRGAFEYQGQKCSAASRAYIPSNLWRQVEASMVEDIESFKMGNPEDFRNFINAVIDEKSFDSLSDFITRAKEDSDVRIVAGGTFDKSEGYFIHPTVLKVKDPLYTTMCTELFGPVLTLYVYDEMKFEETLDLVDRTSNYALTGAIFSQDRNAIEVATKRLVNAAGNFYINDKPTGAVVGQQPFGGARASGTNDKAGSMVNLLRWVSPRSIKENFLPATSYRYSFMEDK
ncbi:MAG: L-glutamate gamma-semialdehyde dehydrogenase [Chitinophagales bacterium]|nr:L-glutamate gamma-semialdehyde dehydrogenase [Chitinophagales bacterium]